MFYSLEIIFFPFQDADEEPSSPLLVLSDSNDISNEDVEEVHDMDTPIEVVCF